jgi:hypothetical protein
MRYWTELIILVIGALFWVWLFYFFQKRDEKEKEVKDDKDINDYLLK